jgi:hypothetical protein
MDRWQSKKYGINTQLQTKSVIVGPSDSITSNNQNQAMIINVVREGWEF